MDVFVDNVTGAHGAPLSEDTNGPRGWGITGGVALMRPSGPPAVGLERPLPPARSIILASKGSVVGYKLLYTLRGHLPLSPR